MLAKISRLKARLVAFVLRLWRASASTYGCYFLLEEKDSALPSRERVGGGGGIYAPSLISPVILQRKIQRCKRKACLCCSLPHFYCL